MTEPYDLNLTHVHFQRICGDITVFGTWFGGDRRPALVLLPTARIGHDRVMPCVVPLASAFAWDRRTGDPRHCARVSALFAENLGLNPHNAFTLMRITSLIQDHMGDLLSIPPKPAETYVAADACFTDEHGTTRYAEILDHV